MNTTSNSPASTLDEENRAANALLEVLKKEQSQLIAADIDSLTALTEEKTRLVSAMSDLATRRYSALANAGFEAQELGMQAWLKNAPPAASQASRENSGSEIGRASCR